LPIDFQHGDLELRDRGKKNFAHAEGVS
jgi:hypothetical protein